MARNGTTRGRGSSLAAAVFAAWWAYVVIDFVIHAVLLQRWWRSTASFWLPPVELAKRLPIGYAGIALYCTGLCWLMTRIRTDAWRVLDGTKVGAVSGGVFGSVATLGVYSIVRVPPSFLPIGVISTTACSTAAGAAATWVASGTRKWRRVMVVLAVGFGIFAVGVVAQSMLRGGQR